MKKFILSIALLLGLGGVSQQMTAQNLVPIPLKMQTAANERPLVWYNVATIDCPESLNNEKEHLLRILKDRAGISELNANGTAKITLSINPDLTDDEAYTLHLNADGVEIVGKTAAGVFYGVMTLEQLMIDDNASARCLETAAIDIEDAPRTHVRELMVDPCRIFIPYERLKEIVPEMARYKLNSIHLHLVDDQAWRIEIKKYPELIEKSTSRVGMDDMLMPISGYYTQEQMKDFVAYCAKYHVMVVPEIEMPGHEVAAIHAFPELTCGAKEVPIRTTCGVSDNLLCPGNEFTYEFLGNVFREMAEVFPCKYIHLGGDEAGNPALDCWTTCEKDKALKKKLGITTTDRSENWKLQKYMFDRVIDTLRTKYDKIPMFWYETDFKEIQEGCVTFAWRNGLTQPAINAAVENNAKIMMCPGDYCYFDYPMAKGDMPETNWGMPVRTFETVYEFDPGWNMGAEFEENNLFGVAGTLWSECINSPERIFYQAYPRSLILAEAGWSAKKNRSWKGFLKRSRPIMLDLQRRGITFSMPTDYIDLQ